MPISLSHPSQKQSLLAIIGIGIAVVLLLVLGGVYGRFLKTQVASSDRNFIEDTALRTDTLDPGVYTLRLRAENDSRVFAQASTTFEIFAAVTPTPTISALPTSTPIITATPLPPY